MDINQYAALATIVGAGCAVIALVTVLFQLRHLTAANFTTAWETIAAQLQADDVRVGRAICRHLNQHKSRKLPVSSLPSDLNGVLDSIRHDFPGYEPTRPPWFYIAKAYDGFDMAAILAWHSHIPGLWFALVSEYEDGIIDTWEAGAPLLVERRARGRSELYECFSTLYISAVNHRKAGRGLYPYCGLFRAVKQFREHPGLYVAWKARRKRDGIPAFLQSRNMATH